MRNVLLLPLLIVSIAGLGCSEDSDASGVEATKSIQELSNAEREELCSWGLELQGGAGESFDCGEGVTVQNATLQECVGELSAAAHCELIVSDFEACIRADAERDVCEDEFPSECDFSDECATHRSEEAH